MLLPSLLLALATSQQAAPQLAVRAVRFYAPASGETSVLALLQVPYMLAEPAGDRIAWQTTVTVEDGQGTTLFREQWYSGAPASFRIPEAYGMEPLRFPAMKPGHYLLRVTVADSLTGRSTSTTAEIDGFAEAPLLSDLLIASRMRIVAPQDTTTLAGEVARGSMRFVTTPQLTLDALTPLLAFMLEAYTDAEATATTRLSITPQDGGEAIYTLAPFEQTVPAGGGVIRGQFPLEGLGEGRYLLVAEVTTHGQTVRRTAPFAVGSLEAAMARELAQKTAERGLDETFFGAMPEDELDAAAEVLQVLAKPDELAVYQARGDGALTVAAKRQFLIQFWAQRDDTPATAVNETRMRFYDAIEYANAQYGEGGRNAQPGWKTDRGRIFVKFGRPDDVQAWTLGQGAPPFEIWRYTQGRNRFFVFADRNNFGHYTLIKTNDLSETSAPNWCEILTPLVVQRDVEPFLGQRFLTASGGGSNPETSIGTQLLCK
ncbi:MAG TPA: GWxTD domain-containing protein [Gemmatimonadales bacterium]|nr:GWxTD domain-containing protein [Gemmatimonadales bacterium]